MASITQAAPLAAQTAVLSHANEPSTSARRVCNAGLNAKHLGSPLRLSRKSAFMGTEVHQGRTVGSRVTCVATLANPADPATAHRLELMEDVENRRARAESSPLEGIPFSLEDFQAQLAKFDMSFEVGDVVRGVVFSAEKGGILVDIGAKAPALLTLAEACIYKIKGPEEVGLLPGTQEEFMITDEDSRTGRLMLSLRKLQYDIAWERCRQLQADDIAIRGKVLQMNRGGIMVLAEGLRGFVPLSHVGVRNKEELLGQEIPLKFLEVDEERTRLVLSNRRAMTENQIQSFGVGDVVVGTVQAVKPYGAFIDIGGMNGLLHISQISSDRITNVENVLKEGDKIKVMILSHDRDRGRVSLSTKKLEPSPGDMLRDPALVFEKAEEMAKSFRERVAQAEAAARAEELRVQQEGVGLRLDLGLGPGGDDYSLEGLDIPPAEDI